MTAAKYAVILDGTMGPLKSLASRMEAQDFKVIVVPEASAALAFARSYAKLCLVAVNAGAVGPFATRFVSAVRALEVPLVWIGSGEVLKNLEHSEEQAGRERILEEVPPAEDLAAIVDELLRSHFYPQEVQQALIKAAIVSMDGFGVDGELCTPFLRASRARLGELNAILSFAGRGMAGHVLVSSSVEAASMVAERVFGCGPAGVSEDHMVDVIGELCNRAIGRLQGYFERQGAPARFGVPVFVRGAQGELWDEARAPSLCLEYGTNAGPIFVELSFSLRETTSSNPHMPDDGPSQDLEGCIFL